VSCLLFHVPHFSLKIPNRYWDICTKNEDYIRKTNFFLSDVFTDKLIPNKCHKLIFKYSRLFCDVEKFKDDSKEVMSKKGMGVVYMRDCDGFISIPNKEYKKKVIKTFYDKHHQKLDKIVTTMLHKYNRCILVDFHSFSDEMVKKLFSVSSNPDICIGINENYTDEKLIQFTVNHFLKYGYSVSINTPYSGTMIPNKYFNKQEKRLSSIMIEINKRVYLKDKNSFYKLKDCISDYPNRLSIFDEILK